MKHSVALFSAFFFWVHGLLAQCDPSATLTYWIAHNLPPAPNFSVFNVDVVDERTIWATGTYVDAGSLDFKFTWIKSNNSGCTWELGTIPLSYNVPYAIKGIFGKNRNVAYVIGEKLGFGNPTMGGSPAVTTLLRTTNGGLSWSNPLPADAFSAVGSYSNFVHFFNTNDGLICGDMSDGYPEIYTSKDGGANWARIPADNVPAMANLEKFDRQFSAQGDTIWVATNQGNVYRSVDKGEHWTSTLVEKLNYIAKPSFFSISFRDARNGIIVFDTYDSWHTADGGTTWTAGPAIPAGALKAIPGTNTYLIGGAPMRLSTDDGYTWTPLAPFGEGVNNCDFFNTKIAWGYSGNRLYEWRAPKIIGTQLLPTMAVTSLRQTVPVQQEISYFGVGNLEMGITTELKIKRDGISISPPVDSKTITLPRNGQIKTTLEFLPSQTGNYEITTQGVSKLDNTVVYQQALNLLVTDTLVAKGMAKTGEFVTYGMSSGASFSRGTQLDIVKKDTLTALSILYKNNTYAPSNDCQVKFLVHGFSPGSAIPDKILYQSSTHQITSADVESWIYHSFSEPLVLEPGKYVLQVNVQGSGSQVFYFGGSTRQRDTAVWIRSNLDWYKVISGASCLVFRAHFNPLGSTVAATSPAVPDFALTCAPNPTQGVFTLVAHLEAPTVLQLQILDATGKMLLQQQTTAPAGAWSERFDLSAFPNGVFFVRAAQEDRIWMGKVIKN